MKAAAKHSFLFLPIALIAAVLTMGFQSVGAQSPLAHKPKPTATMSYVRVDDNGAAASTYASPCSSPKLCANGIRFLWKADKCVKTPGNPPFNDRFPPFPIVYTEKGQAAPSITPQTAPCSTGIQESWTAKNVIYKPLWRGSSNATSGQEHFPKTADGVDIFFQAGDSLVGMQWMKNGKTDGAMIKPAIAVTDVYWYSGTPPPMLAASHRAPAVRATVRHEDLPSPPTVVMLGRISSGAQVTTSNKAPSYANDVDYQWYPAHGTNPACIVYDGHTWTSPSMAFEYTSGGILNSRVTILQCQRGRDGNIITVNGVDFKWQPSSGSENVVYAAVATYNGAIAVGVPGNAIPQPPANTDGVQFGFHRDDYSKAVWTTNGTVLNPLYHPGHPVMATWYGGAVGTW